ncbi:unnamed protein product [Rotaria socialis]
MIFHQIQTVGESKRSIFYHPTPFLDGIYRNEIAYFNHKCRRRSFWHDKKEIQHVLLIGRQFGKANLFINRRNSMNKERSFDYLTINFDRKSYHTDCFRCSQCHRPVADNFAPRCSKCTQPIVLEPAVTCDGKKYHSDCFSCGQCHKPVTDSEYYTHLGEPCCAKCFTERIAFRCAECFRIISDGKSITCDGKHYHSECLHCGQCKKPLATEKDLFKHNEKPCCSRCHEEHFAPRCSKCSRPIKDINYSTYENQSFHSDCFTCWKCHRVIHSSEKFCTDQAGFLCLTCAK